MAGSFKFGMGGIDHKLTKFDNKVERALVAVMGFYAPKAEAWMKHNAPWKDRTTNARNGLFTQFFKEASRIGFVLAHRVNYGIYLELPRKNKKRTGKRSYPIIVPAMKMWGPRTMKKMNRLIDRMR